jgi:hypothetical protein
MKKVKRYAGEDDSFVEDDEINLAVKAAKKPDVEAMKSGIASGAAAKEDEYAPKTRTFSTTGPEKPKPAAPKKASQSFGLNPREKDLQSASEVMKGGQAGQRPTQRMTNAPLDKLKADRKVAAFNAERKAAAEERKKTARSTTSAIPYDSVNPNQYKMEKDPYDKSNYKSGGSVGSASKRADGCAQRGKTKGRMV